MNSPILSPGSPGYEEEMARQREASERFRWAALTLFAALVLLGFGVWILAEEMGFNGWYGVAIGYVLTSLGVNAYSVRTSDDEEQAGRLLPLLLMIAFWPLFALGIVADRI